MATDLNARLGRGVGSRVHIQEADLPDGWRIERTSHKCYVWYDEKGKRYRTSTEVKMNNQNVLQSLIMNVSFGLVLSKSHFQTRYTWASAFSYRSLLTK